MKKLKYLILLSVFTLSTPLCAAPAAQSGPAKVSLLEVYSSEGCSSCPPADEWVSHLSKNSGLWKNFVPVVFHVDYWDALGWKDKFAERKFSERQSDYSEAWGKNGQVYTPGFVLDGKEWRNWHQHRSVDSPDKETAGILSVDKIKDNLFRIHFEPQGKNQSLRSAKAHVALLGFGIDSNIKAGENAGRNLRHDFVVIAYAEQMMDLSGGVQKDGNQFEKEILLNLNKNFKPKKYAVAAWVSSSGSPAPLQSAGASLN